MPCIIYADLESVIEKINGCKNNLEKSSTTKVSEHIPSGFQMSTQVLSGDFQCVSGKLHTQILLGVQ